jgi:hypothetical protein
MAFPSVISSFTNPAATDRLNSPSHSSIETAQNNELVQIEKVIGVEGASSVVGSLQYFIKSPASSGGGHVQGAAFGGTGQTSFIKGDMFVATSASVISKLAIGTDTQVLTADSTQSSGLKWGAPANPVQMRHGSEFSGAARAGAGTLTGSGTITYGTQGVDLATTVTGNSASRLAYQLTDSTTINLFSGSPTFSCTMSCVVLGAANGLIGCATVGLLTVNASGVTLTGNHFGFKLIREAGVYNLYGTQSGGTESATAVLTTATAGDVFDLMAVLTSDTSAVYYYRKNGGALTASAALSTNIPSSATNSGHFTFGVSNIANAANLDLLFGGFSYTR